MTTDDIVVEIGVIPPVPEATPNSEKFESRTEALPSICNEVVVTDQY